MGSDFLKRNFGGGLERLAQDMEFSLAQTKKSALSEAAAYDPALPAEWAAPAPTTLAEALDRLAHHVKTGAGAVPIIKLP